MLANAAHNLQTLSNAHKFSSSPAWLLGRCYKFGINGNDEDDEPLVRLFEDDFTSRVWVTYRKEFPKIAGSTYSSDAGWGCMLRSGQMLLAHTFVCHLLGRDWRLDPSNVQSHIYAQIIRWFIDVPDGNSPFSIHNLLVAGRVFNKKIGEWYGPQETCVAMQKCMDAFTSSVASIGGTTTSNGLPVGGGASLSLAMYLCDDGTVYLDRVHRICARSPSSPITTPTLAPTPVAATAIPAMNHTNNNTETKHSPNASPSPSPSPIARDNVGVPFVSLGDPSVGVTLTSPSSVAGHDSLASSSLSSSPTLSPSPSPPMTASHAVMNPATSPLSLSSPTILAATMTGSSVGVTLSARSPSPLDVGTATAANLKREPVMEGDPLGVRPGAPYIEPVAVQPPRTFSSGAPTVESKTTPMETKKRSSTSLDADWRALLILIPVRLGVDRLNPDYMEALLRCYSFPQSLGVIGGKPRSSLYFVGVQDERFFYLDPHTVQKALTPADDLHTNSSSYHCQQLASMPVTSIDPSLAIGFYCRTRADFNDFIARAKDMAKMKHPVFYVADVAPSYGGDSDDEDGGEMDAALAASAALGHQGSHQPIGATREQLRALAASGSGTASLSGSSTSSNGSHGGSPSGSTELQSMTPMIGTGTGAQPLPHTPPASSSSSSSTRVSGVMVTPPHHRGGSSSSPAGSATVTITSGVLHSPATSRRASSAPAGPPTSSRDDAKDDFDDDDDGDDDEFVML